MVRVAQTVKLQPRPRKGESLATAFSSISLADIQWTLQNFRPILARYGYDEIYDIWVQAYRQGSQMDRVAVEGRIQAAYLRTAPTANWAEYWHRLTAAPESP